LSLAASAALNFAKELESWGGKSPGLCFFSASWQCLSCFYFLFLGSFIPGAKKLYAQKTKVAAGFLCSSVCDAGSGKKPLEGYWAIN